MFSLLCGAFHYLIRRPQYNILMIGLDGAGKTTILEQIKSLYLNLPPLKQDQIRTTVGLNIAQFDVNEPHKCSLTCWDLGGQRSLRGLWDKYFIDADATMFVIDSSAADRFDESLIILEKLVQYCVSHSMPLLIIVNKQDIAATSIKGNIESILNAVNAVSLINVREFCHVQPTTALIGNGIEHGMKWLINTLVLKCSDDE